MGWTQTQPSKNPYNEPAKPALTVSFVLARFTLKGHMHGWPEQQRPLRSTLREPSQTSTAPWPPEGSAEQRWAWHLHHGYLRSLLQMATIWSRGSISQAQQHGRRDLLPLHGNDHEWTFSTTAIKIINIRWLTAFAQLAPKRHAKDFLERKKKERGGGETVVLTPCNSWLKKRTVNTSM